MDGVDAVDGGRDRGWKRESDAVGRVGLGRTGRTRQEEALRAEGGGRERRGGVGGALESVLARLAHSFFSGTRLP